MRSFYPLTTSRLTVFLFVSSFILLMAFSPVRISDNYPRSLSNAELSNLVENALEDSLFQLITEADVERFLGNLKSPGSINQQQWNELAKRKNFSVQEAEYIFSLFGFNSVEELNSYANLLASLGKKYGIDKLDKSSQKSFFEILRKRQNEYITDNSLLEKIYQKSAIGGMPPECWKCVYDFRDCTTGTDGDWVISYTTMSSTWTNYDMRNGGISITRFTYNSPSRPSITYVNSSYSTTTCEGMYRNCMMGCKTP